MGSLVFKNIKKTYPGNGRAIVRNPKVFLMDEPLSNLDAKLRDQMRIELIRLHQELKSTFVYVTHDQTEAMTMGTRIVAMRDGTIQQVASPKDLYKFPANMFVAGFIGSPQMNFVRAEASGDGGKAILNFCNEKIELSDELSCRINERGYAGGELIMGIRPEHIGLTENIGKLQIKGTVSALELMGADVLIHADVGDETFVVKASSEINVNPGEAISLFFQETNLYLFDADTEETIF